MREIRLYDSLNGELTTVSPGDAIRVEVRTSPVVTHGGVVDVASTRPFVLFSFLERYLRGEGFGTKFLFDSPSGGDALYELAEAGSEEEPEAPDAGPRSEHRSRRERRRRGGRRIEEEESGMGLLPVPRSDVDRWVNVCFGADRLGREWQPAAPDRRVPLNEALRTFGHPAVALYLLGAHYAQPLGDAHAGLVNGARHARRIREALPSLARRQPSPPDMRVHLDEFRDALADDLDTPNALVAMFNWLLEAGRRGGRVGDRDLHSMLAVFELEDLVEPLGDLVEPLGA